MKQTKTQFTPILTTEAGSCLTLANWQEVGIDTVTYYLEALLVKPGITYLKMLPSLRTYVGWQGTIVLNASLTAAANKEGIYTLRSPYDGSFIAITIPELFSLIQTLQPDKVILPAGLTVETNLNWQLFPKAITSYLPFGETLPAADLSIGRYLFYDKTKPFSDFTQAIKAEDKELMYVAGEFDLAQLLTLHVFNLHVESDKPAKEAMLGQVFHPDGAFDIRERNALADNR